MFTYSKISLCIGLLSPLQRFHTIFFSLLSILFLMVSENVIANCSQLVVSNQTSNSAPWTCTLRLHYSHLWFYCTSCFGRIVGFCIHVTAACKEKSLYFFLSACYTVYILRGLLACFASLYIQGGSKQWVTFLHLVSSLRSKSHHCFAIMCDFSCGVISYHPVVCWAFKSEMLCHFSFS